MHEPSYALDSHLITNTTTTPLTQTGDTRFDEMRSHFFRFAGFWVFQIIWVFVVSLPVLLLNSPIVSDPARGGANPSFGYVTDILGVILWAIGFVFEAVGDVQKVSLEVEVYVLGGRGRDPCVGEGKAQTRVPVAMLR